MASYSPRAGITDAGALRTALRICGWEPRMSDADAQSIVGAYAADPDDALCLEMWRVTSEMGRRLDIRLFAHREPAGAAWVAEWEIIDEMRDSSITAPDHAALDATLMMLCGTDHPQRRDGWYIGSVDEVPTRARARAAMQDQD